MKGEDGLLCSYCEEGHFMTQRHCLECSARADLRTGLELSNIQDMVVRKMLSERARLDAESVSSRQHCTTRTKLSVLITLLLIFKDLMPFYKYIDIVEILKGKCIFIFLNCFILYENYIINIFFPALFSVLIL